VAPRARVALVDDHELFREGLRMVIGQTRDFEVAGEAGTARDAVQLFTDATFDVAVVDVTLPDLSGVSVTREVCRLQPRCKVLALSMVEQPYRAAEMLRAGASGYALKSQSTDEILDAIRVVAGGGRYLAPRLPHDLVESLRSGAAVGPIDQLTPREREIFGLLVRGWTSERIASQLFISTRTVETHRQNIMAKLQVHSAVELVRLAAQHGLIQD